MKVAARQIDAYVKNPPPEAKIILIYGPDEGLMRERSNIVAKTVVDDIQDPFNVVDISEAQLNDSPSMLSDEAFSMSMMGGRRLIILRGSGIKATEAIKLIESESERLENMILIQAGNLTPKSALRKLAEKSKNMAAIPCYVEDQGDLARFLSSVFTEAGYRINRDALDLASTILHGDRAVARGEAEKILIYKGEDNSAITAEDITNCLGRGNLETLDMLADNVASGDCKGVEKSLSLLFAEDTSVVYILRSMKNYFSRLYLAQTHMKDMPFDAAIKKLYPPVFFKQKDAFRRHLNVWSFKRLKLAFTAIYDAEKQVKSSGSNDHLVCNRALLSLAKMVSR